jgi:hypothetical protein
MRQKGVNLPLLLRVTVFFAALSSAAFSASLVNGDFEAGLTGWSSLWTREPGAGSLGLDTKTTHGGKHAVLIEHHGAKDWSFQAADRLPVEPGDFFDLEAWVKIQNGGATLCVSTWDGEGKIGEWLYAARSAGESTDWKRLHTRFIVPPGIATIQVRLLGSGASVLRADDFSLTKRSNINQTRRQNLPATLTVSNATLEITFDTARATLAVLDRRSGRTFRQEPFDAGIIVMDAKADGDGLHVSLFHTASGLQLEAILRAEKDLPEFIVTLDGDGEQSEPIPFPAPFVSPPGDYLVLPLNEGISYPVEDTSIEPMRLVAYAGHGICMAFWGATDGERGQMAIIETPDDAAVRLDRIDGRLVIGPEWDAQRGRVGYGRSLRYIFFDQGGHVAMAKRYRAYAQKTGLFKTLAEKQKEIPAVDLLVGAVNVWCWDANATDMVQEMQAAGIHRILWSNKQSPKNLKVLNAAGVLTSRYDIYQDVMDPAKFDLLPWLHPDWTTGAWPKDLVIDAKGNWKRGWAIEAKDGSWHPCGVTCDLRALNYARERIPAELATHPYRSRFIDTTTAAPWVECYDPHHAMTRTDSRRARMELLRYVSEDCNLVTGCETGHDASVPYLHYFEGMLSLGPYRVPDSGRAMTRIWSDVPKNVAKFQLGHAYRLPLWELVYHDCVVAQWYWGDYNNKLPALWDKRDLFNVLYGTPPMFMFERKLWSENKERFVQSYQNTAPFVRAAGYSEMTDHRFLTADRDVQQTTFANGMTVTVNFGSAVYNAPDGTTLAEGGFHVTGMPR